MGSHKRPWEAYGRGSQGGVRAQVRTGHRVRPPGTEEGLERRGDRGEWLEYLSPQNRLSSPPFQTDQAQNLFLLKEGL